eukprot:5910765-Amphidinium_carterae.2
MFAVGSEAAKKLGTDPPPKPMHKILGPNCPSHGQGKDSESHVQSVAKSIPYCYSATQGSSRQSSTERGTKSHGAASIYKYSLLLNQSFTACAL